MIKREIYTCRPSLDNSEQILKVLQKVMKREKCKVNKAIETIILEYGKTLGR